MASPDSEADSWFYWKYNKSLIFASLSPVVENWHHKFLRSVCRRLLSNAKATMRSCRIWCRFQTNSQSARRPWKVVMPRTKKYYGMSSISHYGPQCFNEVDVEIKKCKNIEIFTVIIWTVILIIILRQTFAHISRVNRSKKRQLPYYHPNKLIYHQIYSFLRKQTWMSLFGRTKKVIRSRKSRFDRNVSNLLFVLTKMKKTWLNRQKPRLFGNSRPIQKTYRFVNLGQFGLGFFVSVLIFCE